ncbi:hypothetical protein DICA1_A03180 [Diutina catenulata]
MGVSILNLPPEIIQLVGERFDGTDLFKLYTVVSRDPVLASMVVRMAKNKVVDAGDGPPEKVVPLDVVRQFSAAEKARFTWNLVVKSYRLAQLPFEVDSVTFDEVYHNVDMEGMVVKEEVENGIVKQTEEHTEQVQPQTVEVYHPQAREGFFPDSEPAVRAKRKLSAATEAATALEPKRSSTPVVERSLGAPPSLRKVTLSHINVDITISLPKNLESLVLSRVFCGYTFIGGLSNLKELVIDETRIESTILEDLVDANWHQLEKFQWTQMRPSPIPLRMRHCCVMFPIWVSPVEKRLEIQKHRHAHQPEAARSPMRELVLNGLEGFYDWRSFSNLVDLTLVLGPTFTGRDHPLVLPPNVEKLAICNSHCSQFGPTTFTSLKKLTHLRLKSVWFDVDQSQVFRGDFLAIPASVTHLTVYSWFKSVESVPEHVTHLDLSHNQIKKVATAFTAPLEELWLSDNQLSAVELVCPRLRLVELWENPLERVAVTSQRLTRVAAPCEDVTVTTSYPCEIVTET